MVKMVSLLKTLGRQTAAAGPAPLLIVICVTRRSAAANERAVCVPSGGWETVRADAQGALKRRRNTLHSSVQPSSSQHGREQVPDCLFWTERRRETIRFEG